MIRAATKFLWLLPRRLGAIARIVNDPVLSRTYYPQVERKSKTGIWLDNLWWLLRNQEVNLYYFLYGMDRKHGPDPREYLAAKEFQKYQEQTRAAAAVDGQRIDYHCLIHDKFLFCQYVTSLGFPTPPVLALGDKTSLWWVGGAGRQPVESLLDRELDGFYKELVGEGGRGVMSFSVAGGRLYVNDREQSMTDFLAGIRGHYIIQRRMRQHPRMAELYPHSVNTIRLVTMRTDGDPKPFCAILRMGTQGRRADNWSIGGVCSPVDLDTGIVGKYGVFHPAYGTRTDRHPDTGMAFEGFGIPFFAESLAMTLKLHSLFYGMHSIGWDIGIGQDGPQFLEANDKWAIDLLQGAHGGLKRRYLELLPGAGRGGRRL